MISQLMKWIAVSLLVVLSVWMAGCNKPAAQAGFKMPPPTVTVAVAVSADVPLYLDEIGTCTARQYVMVMPQVTGPITKLYFSDGAEVHQGDKLFTIDPRPYQDALEQALANQQQAKAALDLAKTEKARMDELLPTKAISQDDYDKMKSQDEVTQAQLAAADAAVKTAQLNLEYCTIISPVNGRAGQRMVDAGNVVQANQTGLLSIQTLDPIYVDFTIAEGELPSVRDHAKQGTLKVRTRLPTDSSDIGDGAEGDLTFIDTQVQDQAGRVKLRATMPNPQRHFWPGQFVNVRLILNVEKDAVLIPVAAEQIGQTGPYVYVVKPDSTAELRPIKAGQRQGDQLVIEEGVKAGEKVIIAGQMLVAPGAPVSIAPNTPTTDPTTAPTTAPAPTANAMRDEIGGLLLTPSPCNQEKGWGGGFCGLDIDPSRAGMKATPTLTLPLSTGRGDKTEFSLAAETGAGA